MMDSDLQKKVAELEAQIRKLKKNNLGLVFEDKPESIVEQCQKEIPVLKEVKKNRVYFGEQHQSNLLIEGDNYHSLFVLNYTHKSKIDLIYIDPPYNTGNRDFIYNDQYVDREDGYRHSKWLSFMRHRLILARDLLSPTGFIFISIDNNEQAHLRILCDKIFGERNFVGMFVWRKKEGGGQADAYFVTEHEYILVYAKSERSSWLDEEIPVDEAQYNKEDEHGKFTAVKLAKWGNTARRADRPKMHFPIKAPNGKNVYPIAPDGGEGRWRVGKKRMEMLIAQDLVFWQERDGQWIAYEKVYYDEEEVKKVKERSILFDLATTADGTNELTAIFGKKDTFENPKPTELIQFFLRYGANSEATILDFFAGSGTTGHAVLKLNAEDGGNRRFILCTNNESNNGNGKGIAADVCYPRIKKVIEGYGDVVGLPSNLFYYQTDFVDIEKIHKVPDDAKIRLTYEAGAMIAVREDTLNEIDKNDSWQIFEGQSRLTAIFFNEDKSKLGELVEKLEIRNLPTALYIFSWGKNEYKGEYSSHGIRVEDIPEPIIEVYKELNRV